MAGQVFVVRGDLRNLYCDARMVPVFREVVPNEKARWLRGDEMGLCEKPHHPADYPDRARTWRLGRGEDGPWLWVTQVGLHRPGMGRDLAWAIESCKEYLQKAFEHLQSVPSRPLKDRAVPLLAMHVVASGEKNAGDRVGEIVPRLLGLAWDFTDTHDADVVIVTNDDIQYAALQAYRQTTPRPSTLPLQLTAEVEKLTSTARNGRQLALFTGAGVSMPAGLPNWSGLLVAVGKKAGLIPMWLAGPREFRLPRRLHPLGATAEPASPIR